MNNKLETGNTGGEFGEIKQSASSDPNKINVYSFVLSLRSHTDAFSTVYLCL